MLALLVSPPPALAAEKPPKLQARAWTLIDASTGESIAGRAESKRLPIASTTKLMTLYLALQELPLGRKIPAAKYEANAAESVLGLRPGEKLTVRDLVYAVVLQSANDAAVTLAEGVAGSQKNFVREMNDMAAALGLANTHYTTPVGLDEPGNRSSAGDLVTLGRLLLQDKVFAKIADSPRAVLRSGAQRRTIITRNLLLNSDPSVNGIKTGHTLDAGYVLVGSARRKGVELVSAVLGTASEGARDAETAKLLDYGFSLFKREVPVKRRQVMASAEIEYESGKLDLLAARRVSVGVRSGQRATIQVQAPSIVKGPISEGQQLGHVVALLDGREVGRTPLIAERTVPAAGFAKKVASRGWLLLLLLLVGGFVIAVGFGRKPWQRRSQGTRPVAPPPKPRDPEEIERLRETRRQMREERRRNRKETQR